MIGKPEEKIIEIGVYSEPNAPRSFIISNDNSLYLLYYTNASIMHQYLPDNITDEEICITKFLGCIQYKFGMPGDEVISGHPYYKLGLRSGVFYEVEYSQWIEDLRDMASIHPYFNAKKWKEVKHYILTFKDNTFECIATGYETKKVKISMQNATQLVLKELFTT